MKPSDFRRIVNRAVRELPAEFRPYVDECVFIIQPRASPELRREMELADDEDLYGLYEALPLTERRLDDPPELPPRILLFYEPLLEDCRTEAELRHEIQATVLHEVGHHFGLDEKRLAELGYE